MMSCRMLWFWNVNHCNWSKNSSLTITIDKSFKSNWQLSFPLISFTVLSKQLNVLGRWEQVIDETFNWPTIIDLFLLAMVLSTSWAIACRSLWDWYAWHASCCTESHIMRIRDNEKVDKRESKCWSATWSLIIAVSKRWISKHESRLNSTGQTR